MDENGMTSIPKVFAGGDIVNINLDAVTAIADAKVAAEGIHKFLTQKPRINYRKKQSKKL
ncbi:hypothetical protein J7K43_00025 [Candidatus Calescamantes bacterium]|nr:hypothetical protein [Candidatus Calescamantes bacterium]